jgi:hypothetical protein
MKKAFFLTMVILLIVGFATAKTPVTPITQNDLKDLKGEWTGKRGLNLETNLTIDNDNLPLTGEVELFSKRGAPKTYSFENGSIEDGKLVINCEDIGLRLRLELQKDDSEMKLVGDIDFSGRAANVIFEKKQ